MILTWENRSNRSKTCPSASSSTTGLTLTALGSEPGSPTTTHLSYNGFSKIDSTLLSSSPRYPKKHSFLVGSQASPVFSSGKSNV